MARRRAAAAQPQAAAADDLYDSVGVSQPQEPEKKTGSPIEDVTGTELAEMVRRWIPAAIVADKAKNRKKNEAELIKAEMIKWWAKRLMQSGSQPKNPLLVVRDNQGRIDLDVHYQVQKSFFPQSKKAEDILAALTAALGKDRATTLFNTELDTKKVKGCRDFKSLMFGKKVENNWQPATEAEKAVATKLLQMIKTNFTQAEQDLLLFEEDSVRVKDGFFGHLKNYCQTEEEVTAVVASILHVKHFLSRPHYGLAMNDAERMERLGEDLADLIGSGTDDDEDDEDDE